MATITACTSTLPMARAALVHKAASTAGTILGLSSRSKNVGIVRCSMEVKPQRDSAEPKSVMVTSLMAAACAATMSTPAAVALVDERMSTEGTGLPFGLSNNLLGWILLGVFALIWSLYFVYTASLDEDDDSGLSL